MPTTAMRRTRRERDRQRRTIATIAVAAIVGLSLLVLATGYYVLYLRTPVLPVATVDGDVIRRAAYQRESRLRTYDVQIRLQAVAQQLRAHPNQPGLKAEQARLQAQSSASPDQIVTDMIDRDLISRAVPVLEQQGAPAAALTVTSAEVDQRLAAWKQQGHLTTTAFFQQLLQQLQVSEAQLRAELRAQLLRNKVRTYVTRDIAAIQPEVKARQLTLTSKATADAALAKLHTGDPFAAVVTQYSTDATAKANGGELGWTPKGLQTGPFDRFAFGSPPPAPFTISPVLPDGANFVLYQIQDRAQARPVQPNELNQLKRAAFSTWLAVQEKAATITRYPQNLA